MRKGLLPVLLFAAAAAGALFLGTRILASERAAAERTARESLRARAREAAGTLVAEASRRMRTSGPEGAALLVHTRRGELPPVLDPPLPTGIPRLVVPPGSDPEGTFYLQEAERAEAVDGDAARARGLYGAAADPRRDPTIRLLALFRTAALERRGGDEAAARRAEAAFLEAEAGGDMPPTFEDLVVRTRLHPADSGLRKEILRHVGSRDEALAQGLLAACGSPDAADVADRREEIRRTERLLPLLRRATSQEAGEGAWYGAGRLVTWTRFKTLSDGGGPPHIAFHEGDRPLPAGIEAVEEVPGPGGPDVVAESVAVGPPFEGLMLRASTPRAAVEADARRGAWLLGGALAALLLAGGAAFTLSVRAARREAEAARARAAFVTKVGHDLRTPLAVVRMYAETLAAGRVADPAEAREFAAVAAREAERLSGMVGQVLDLSRVEEGAGALARGPLDLAALAAEVAEVHRPLLGRAGLRFEVRAEGPLPVLGDSAALRGAVSNLLENAARHGASGGTVEVEARRDGRMGAVRVRDRGPGLPPGMEARLFDRFVRGPGAVGAGAGLGLALVREAAEAHGGRAEASNREGGGAEFALLLPLAEEGA